MSIASEITRLQTSKADSKAQINIDKDIINDGIDFINNEKVDSYDEKIAEMQEAYKAFIPINTTSDTQIDAQKGGTIIGKTIKGNTTQDGTPTPDAPVEVKNVTGLQTVTISNGTDSEDYEINLENIELNKIGNYQDFIRKGSGKNLFNKDAITTGKYITDTGGEGTNNTTFYSDFIKVQPNTKYYVSGRNNGWGNEAFYDENKTFISRPNEANNIFTTSSTTYYIRVNGHLNDVNNLQIEQGTTATYHEPYDYKDKWYIEKNVLKLVVPEAVAVSMQNNNKRVYVNGVNLGSNNILRNTSISQTHGLYCDILEEKTAAQTWGGTQGISYDYDSGNNLGCIDFAINGLTTVAEYQNALKGKVIYAIANTPEYTLIDNEELIEQLDRIMQLYEGQNNILVTGDLAATLDLDYIVKAENHL